MKQLLFSTTTLIVALSAFIFGARTYGEAHPQPDELRALHLFEVCDGKPCFKGIVPGETDLKEAMKILEPFITPGYGYASVQEEDSSAVVGFTDAEITEVNGRTTATLGAVVEKFGSPCGVSVYTQGSVQGSVTLYYERTIVEVDPENMALNLFFVSPSWHVARIDMIDPNVTFTDISEQKNPCHITVGDEIGHEDSIWLGFASLAYYHLYARTHPR